MILRREQNVESQSAVLRGTKYANHQQRQQQQHIKQNWVNGEMGER